MFGYTILSSAERAKLELAAQRSRLYEVQLDMERTARREAERKIRSAVEELRQCLDQKGIPSRAEKAHWNDLLDKILKA